MLTLPGMTVVRDILQTIEQVLAAEVDRETKLQCPSVDKISIWISSHQNSPSASHEHEGVYRLEYSGEDIESNDKCQHVKEQNSTESHGTERDKKLQDFLPLSHKPSFRSPSSSSEILTLSNNSDTISKEKTYYAKLRQQNQDELVWTCGAKYGIEGFRRRSVTSHDFSHYASVSTDWNNQPCDGSEKPWKNIGRVMPTRRILLGSLHTDIVKCDTSVDDGFVEKMSGGRAFSGANCMAVDASESILLTGTPASEILLWDLRNFPVSTRARLSLSFSGRANYETRQLLFLDQVNMGLGCCGPSLYLLDFEKGTVLSRFMLSLHRTPVMQFDCQDAGCRRCQEVVAADSTHVYCVDLRVPESVASFTSKEGTNVESSKLGSFLRSGRILNNIAIQPAKNHPPNLSDRIGNSVWSVHSDLDGGSIRPIASSQSRNGYACVTVQGVTGDWYCAGTSNGTIHCWDRRMTNRMVHCWEAHSDAVVSVKALGRHHLLTVGLDCYAHLWDLSGGLGSSGSPPKVGSISGKLNLSCFI